MLKEGDAAPDFESRDAEGNKVRLSANADVAVTLEEEK